MLRICSNFLIRTYLDNADVSLAHPEFTQMCVCVGVKWVGGWVWVWVWGVGVGCEGGGGWVLRPQYVLDILEFSNICLLKYRNFTELAN
jgi:hypothetical protein